MERYEKDINIIFGQITKKGEEWRRRINVLFRQTIYRQIQFKQFLQQDLILISQSMLIYTLLLDFVLLLSEVRRRGVCLYCLCFQTYNFPLRRYIKTVTANPTDL